MEEAHTSASDSRSDALVLYARAHVLTAARADLGSTAATASVTGQELSCANPRVSSSSSSATPPGVSAVPPVRPLTPPFAQARAGMTASALDIPHTSVEVPAPLSLPPSVSTSASRTTMTTMTVAGALTSPNTSSYATAMSSRPSSCLASESFPLCPRPAPTLPTTAIGAHRLPACARCPFCGGCAAHLALCAATRPVQTHAELLGTVYAEGPARRSWPQCRLFQRMAIPLGATTSATRISSASLPSAVRAHLIRCTAEDVEAAYARTDTPVAFSSASSDTLSTMMTTTTTTDSFASSTPDTSSSADTNYGYVSGKGTDCMLTNSFSTHDDENDCVNEEGRDEDDYPHEDDAPSEHGSPDDCTEATPVDAPMARPMPLVTVLHALFLTLSRLETTAYLRDRAMPHVTHAHTTPRRSLYEVAQQHGFTELGLAARALWEHLCFSAGLVPRDGADHEESARDTPSHSRHREGLARVPVGWRDVPLLLTVTPFHGGTSASTPHETGDGGFRLFVPEDFFLACVAQALCLHPHAARPVQAHGWTGWPLHLATHSTEASEDGIRGDGACRPASPTRTWWDTVFRASHLACLASAAATSRTSDMSDAHELPLLLLLHHRQPNRMHQRRGGERVVWDQLAVLTAHVLRRALLSPFTQRLLCAAPPESTPSDRLVLPNLVLDATP